MPGVTNRAIHFSEMRFVRIDRLFRLFRHFRQRSVTLHTRGVYSRFVVINVHFFAVTGGTIHPFGFVGVGEVRGRRCSPEKNRGEQDDKDEQY